MITFQKLWDNYPTITENKNPCSTNGKPNFPNQCAICVGVALSACGFDTRKLPGVRHCWQHKNTPGHVLAAEELAKGLKSFPIAGIGKLQKIEPSEFAEKLRGKKGIIFFKDYWQRTINGKKESFRNRSGDHIDLWNGHRITDWTSWARIHIRIGRFGLHSISDKWSDYEDSKSIWFWRVL